MRRCSNWIYSYLFDEIKRVRKPPGGGGADSQYTERREWIIKGGEPGFYSNLRTSRSVMPGSWCHAPRADPCASGAQSLWPMNSRFKMPELTAENISTRKTCSALSCPFAIHMVRMYGVRAKPTGLKTMDVSLADYLIWRLTLRRVGYL